MSGDELSRFDELVSRYLDGALADNDASELLGLLAERPLGERFLEMSRLTSEIAGLLAAPVPDAAMVALVRADIGECPAATVLRPRLPASQRRPAMWALAWAALFLVMGGAVVWFVNRDRPVSADAPSLVSLTSLRGEVRLIGPHGERAVKAGESWQRGETLKTVGAKSAATVTFEDGSGIEFGSNSVAVNQSGVDGRRVELERGDVRCAVKPQPAGQPFVVATPDAEAIAVGTAFQVTTVDAHHTRVVVTEGQVRVKRPADSTEIMVDAGFHVFIGPKGKLKADPNSTGKGHTIND